MTLTWGTGHPNREPSFMLFLPLQVLLATESSLWWSIHWHPKGGREGTFQPSTYHMEVPSVDH